jgi:hypothetical protein
MSAETSIEGHVLYALRNATVKRWPFPHFFVENVFPWDFYRSMRARLAKKTDFSEAEGRYSGRTFARNTEFPELEFMKTSDFLKNVAKIFIKEVNVAFKDRKPAECGMFHDLRFVRDGIGYAIGPHTDAPWKLVSLLFYLPENWSNASHGTALYTPKDRTFRCNGGPHHDFCDFERIYTAPYHPNSCLGFFKTNNSFHGVERLDKPIERDVLLYNIYDEQIYLQTHKPAPE